MEVQKLQIPSEKVLFWLAMERSFGRGNTPAFGFCVILYIPDDPEATDYRPVDYLLNLCL